MVNRVIYAVDELSRTVGHAFAWCLVILTIGTTYEVFVRYVLNEPTSWAFDFSYLMYGAMFYMAGAYTLSRCAYGFDSMRIRESSVNSPAGVPIWPLKMLIPFGAALLALQGVAEVLRCIQCIRANEWTARLHDVEELEKQILEEHARKAEQEAAAGAA